MKYLSDIGINKAPENGDLDVNGDIYSNGEKVVVGGFWQDWTPSWTNVSGGTLNFARYTLIGKTVHFQLRYTLGGAGVSGLIQFTLPAHFGYLSSNADYPNATVIFADTGVRLYTGTVRYGSSNSVMCYATNETAGYTSQTNTSSSVPFTWGSGDTISVSGTYEAA